MSFFNKSNKRKSKSRPKVSFKKLVKKVNKIERMDRPELKHSYVDFTFTPPMSVEVFPTTSVQHICGLTQGTNGNQRLGNKVMGNHIDLSFSLTNLTALQVNHVAARVMVVVDKKSNQGDIGLNAAVLADLMQVSSVNAQYLDPNNLFNNEYRGRFKILLDKTIELSGNQSVVGTNPGTNGGYVHKRYRLKCPHKLTYDTNVASAASSGITEGTIWLIYKPQQTENTGVLQAAPQMHAFVDYYYTDN